MHEETIARMWVHVIHSAQEPQLFCSKMHFAYFHPARIQAKETAGK
jgi:hypothetical protein